MKRTKLSTDLRDILKLLGATVKLKPLEVAIFNLESKIHELKVVLNCTPCDSNLLQMQLQGGIATAFFSGKMNTSISLHLLSLSSLSFRVLLQLPIMCFLEDVPLPEQG